MGSRSLNLNSEIATLGNFGLFRMNFKFRLFVHSFRALSADKRFPIDFYALNRGFRHFSVLLWTSFEETQIFERRSEPRDNSNRRTSESHWLRNGFPSPKMRRTVAVIIWNEEWARPVAWKKKMLKFVERCNRGWLIERPLSRSPANDARYRFSFHASVPRFPFSFFFSFFSDSLPFFPLRRVCIARSDSRGTDFVADAAFPELLPYHGPAFFVNRSRSRIFRIVR